LTKESGTNSSGNYLILPKTRANRSGASAMYRALDCKLRWSR
jgi:hypothetical protein